MRTALAWILVLAALPASATNGAPLAVVWQERRVEFSYMGRVSRYSCDGLRDKVRALLLDLGARRDLTIDAQGCQDAGTLQRAPEHTLRIVFTSPALPHASAKPAHDGDLTATDARFEAFKIASDAFRNMGVGDCELVEEFVRQILPNLVTRDLHQEVTCTANEPRLNRFLVSGEILKSVPRAELPAARGALAAP